MMRVWIISPNAQSDGNINYWLERSKKENKVFVGYDSDKKHGYTFEETVQIGDYILIAHGSGDNRKLYLAGKVDSPRLFEEQDSIFYRNIVYVITEDELISSNISLNSNNAWGESSNPGTIYELKSTNAYDLQVIKRLQSLIENKQKEMKMRNLADLLKSKKQIILQGPPGTGKTYTAKVIAEKLIFGEVSSNSLMQKERLEDSNQFKLIQFHPSYSYEDFVRGIAAKTNGTQIEYKTENKVFAEFALRAFKSFNDSKKAASVLSKEQWLMSELSLFREIIQVAIDEDGKYPINDTVSIFEVDDDAFRYSGKNWEVANRHRMKFSDVILEQLHNAANRQEIKTIPGISGRAKEHSSYDFKLLEKFRAFLATRPAFVDQNIQVSLQNFVLIIDEINRANLPSVLGELIYALEYRGEAVDSMYELDGDRKLILPPNLFIIGTMNTADRSVGHIDYAIRRRFAFIDIEPSSDIIKEIVPEENGLRDKASKLYDDVASFFTSEKLASDFRAKEIQLGHSYFLAKTKEELALKLDFEIKPLLKEYIKDGILLSKKNEKGEDLTEIEIDNLKIG